MSHNQTTIDFHLDIIETCLRRYGYIFRDDITRCRRLRANEVDDPDLDGYKLTRVGWPTISGKYSQEGFRLKEDMGTIAIEVIYRSKPGNKRSYIEVSHSFRYFNPHHSYEFTHRLEDKPMNVEYFSFRYDKDIRERAVKEPADHIQVMEHNSPRFPIKGEKETSLDAFFDVVLDTCFTHDKGEKIINSGKQMAFFANKS